MRYYLHKCCVLAANVTGISCFRRIVYKKGTTTRMKFPSETGGRMILEEEYNALYFVDRWGKSYIERSNIYCF